MTKRDGLTIEHEIPYVRETAARSLATALVSLPDSFDEYIQKLMNLYEEKVITL